MMPRSIGQLPRHADPRGLLGAPIECASCHATEHLVYDRHWSYVPFCAECLERAGASESDEDAGVGD